MALESTVDFHKTLLETGCYHTPSDRLGKPRKNGLWTSISYNIKGSFRAIKAASTFAKHGELNDANWAACGAHVMWEAERFGTPVSCEGFAERAAYKGPVIYVCNHMSLFETFAFPGMALAFGNLAIVLKESLLHVPILGKTFQSRSVIPVGRSNPREDLKQMMTMGTQFLNEGLSILLYPQGHRRSNFDVSTFNSIGVKLALKAGVPIVPIANQTAFLGTGKYTKDFGPVDVTCPVKFRCGPLLSVSRENQKEVHLQCTNFIADTFEEWGRVEVIR